MKKMDVTTTYLADDEESNSANRFILLLAKSTS